MSEAPVLVAREAEAAITTITLNRPEKRNALDTETCVLVREAVEAAVEAGSRAIVITGAGTAFSAGADLSGGVYAKDFTTQVVMMLQAIESAPVPVIAAINGPAVGAGTQLAIACDLRVVAPGGFFMVPVVKVALAVDNWTVKRLSSLVGGSNARAMLLAAETADAESALRIGLANRAGDLEDAREWARELSGFAPLTIAHLKMLFADDGARVHASAEQDAAARRCWFSEDAKEARLARTERRRPVFRGV